MTTDHSIDRTHAECRVVGCSYCAEHGRAVPNSTTYCCICGQATDGADVHDGACEAALAQYEAEATYLELPAWRRLLYRLRNRRWRRRFAQMDITDSIACADGKGTFKLLSWGLCPGWDVTAGGIYAARELIPVYATDPLMALLVRDQPVLDEALTRRDETR